MFTRYKFHFKETFKLAYPIAIGQLSHVMLGVEDSIMVGKVGSDSLAAASLANGLVFLILVIGLGMTLAITPLVAIANGENNHERCGTILRQSVIVNMLFAVILFIVIYALARIIPFLNQPPAVSRFAASYLKILSISIIPIMFFQIYRQVIEGLSFTRPAMYITIFANFFNILFNWIFIYGHLGVPALGLDGAGYSTLFTRILMALAMIFYVKFSVRFKSYQPVLIPRTIDFPIMRKLIEIGLPSGFQHFFEVGAFAFSAIMIGWLGSVQLAAHQIALNLASISFMIILGIAGAGSIRVSNAVGRQQPEDVQKSGIAAIIMAAVFMFSFAVIFISLKNVLPRIYISDMHVIKTAASLLIIAALFQMSDGVQAVGLGILRGITDVKIPLLISFIAYWVIGIPSGYLLGFVFDLDVIGVWIGLFLGLTVSAVFFTLRFLEKTTV